MAASPKESNTCLLFTIYNPFSPSPSIAGISKETDTCNTTSEGDLKKKMSHVGVKDDNMRICDVLQLMVEE